METSEKKRRWYHLHLGTWVVVLVVGVCLVVVILYGYENVGDMPGVLWQPAYCHGWPTPFLVRQMHYVMTGDFIYYSRWPFDDAQILEFKPAVLSLNILIALTILFSTAFTTEYIFRRRFLSQHFGVKTILTITIAAGIFFTLSRYEIVDWEHLLFIPISFNAPRQRPADSRQGFLLPVGNPVD